jgi:hypothetical protein
MVTDTSTESRKVDKKTALALLESTVLPPTTVLGTKKWVDEYENEGSSEHGSGENGSSVMNFTVITKRGNKQQVGSASGRYSVCAWANDFVDRLGKSLFRLLLLLRSTLVLRSYKTRRKSSI